MNRMTHGRSIYRIFDKDPSSGCHLVNGWIEADQWNRKEWGIFWTVNQFDGPRKKENCKRVISWAVDLDSGTKESQKKKISECFMRPSWVIETARGHHVYFDAIDGDPENYRDIVERLVERFDGDKNAKDICRILRVPGHVHWKGEPFGIKLIHPNPQKEIDKIPAYTEAEMRKAFARPIEVEKEFDQKTELRKTFKQQNLKGDLWERVWNLDCEYALQQISGKACVSFEQFTFKRTSSGNLNIFVNGKGTGCWVDQKRRIGSGDKGGPTIANWINWYQRDWKKTVSHLKDHFPELFK